MNTGGQISGVYQVMKDICTATSQMLCELRTEFSKEGLRQKNSTIMVGKSAAIDQPRFWLPYYQQIVFARYNNKWAPRAISVLVLFEDAYFGKTELKFPIVGCGVLEELSEQRPVVSNNFFNFACQPEIREEAGSRGPLFTAKFPKSADCSAIIGYFLELVALEDRSKLTALIVKPCMDLLNGKASDAADVLAGISLRPSQYLTDYSAEV